ncbi:unnamed protein product [Schistosoma curassoni]|uniref:Uncharacterized protein n=1 Tax=Schistosoma curassoni TaxID=6186 RepID=A0A183JSM5_9TREM|nr:unnamed protein product [Schistosoma curassoni]
MVENMLINMAQTGRLGPKVSICRKVLLWVYTVVASVEI